MGSCFKHPDPTRPDACTHQDGLLQGAGLDGPAHDADVGLEGQVAVLLLGQIMMECFDRGGAEPEAADEQQGQEEAAS